MPAALAGLSQKPDYAERSRFKTAPKTTVKLTGLTKVEPRQETAEKQAEAQSKPDRAYTPEQLQAAWNTFAEQRKSYQLEYHMLTQPYELRGNQAVVHLLSAVQETMLNNIRTELITHLRETLQNYSINVVGEISEVEDKKIMYTPRDKFDYLVEKNPNLRELKDRLGLDPDF